MDCTTLARVKQSLPGTDAAADALLSKLITSVSAVFERSIYRYMQATERTEIYPLRPPARIISLRGSPCTVTDGRGVNLATFTVKVSASQSFSGATALTRNTNYIIEQDRGVLRILDTLDAFTGPMGRTIAPAYVQVTYTGGLAATADALVTAYPDLAGACDQQVVYEFRRRTDLGGGDAKAGDSLAAHSEDIHLLKAVEKVLSTYRRRGG